LVLDVGFMRPLLVWRCYWIDEGYVMSGFKGTPGPWEWFTSNSHMRLSSLATGRDGDVVGAYKAADGLAVVSVKKADADLIASAPELLAALHEFSRLYGRLWDTTKPEGGFLSPESVKEYDRIHVMAEKAIKKALGN